MTFKKRPKEWVEDNEMSSMEEALRWGNASRDLNRQKKSEQREKWNGSGWDWRDWHGSY